MRRILGVTIPTTFAAISLFAFAVPGYAGSNGQQIKVYESSNIGSLCIAGYNQYASWVGYCFTAPAAYAHDNSYSGYWWKTIGTQYVQIEYYGTADLQNHLGGNTCDVPEYQPGNDWWRCNSI